MSSTPPLTASIEVAALRLRDAAKYVSYSVREFPYLPIPRCDTRKAGGKRPVWRWRRSDLDAFLESRTVQPGHRSSQDPYYLPKSAPSPPPAPMPATPINHVTAGPRHRNVRGR